MGPPIFENEKWNMKWLTQGFFKNESFKKSKSQYLNYFRSQSLKCWFQCLNGLPLQWLIFESFKDWFLKASKIDFLNFWFFSFLKNAPFIFIFKRKHFKNEKWRASKMNNQKWKIESKMRNQKFNYWINSIVMQTSGWGRWISFVDRNRLLLSSEDPPRFIV